MRYNEVSGAKSRCARVECSKARKLLPEELLTFVTVLFQDSGYFTVSSRDLIRPDWIIINNQVKRLGGIKVSNIMRSRELLAILVMNSSALKLISCV